MKIQCDVCEKAPATVICCADEAALCAKCDVQVHAANKLASKHQRLLLQCLSTKLPPCDICQEKPAFIFCVEDRALFCKDCDGPIHSAGSLSANHQRFLATGIRVALSSGCSKDSEKRFLDPSNKSNPQYASLNVSVQQTPSYASSWTMDDVLRFSDIGSPQKEEKEQIELGGLEWLNDMGVFEDHPPQDAVAAARVPQLPIAQFSNLISSSRSFKYNEPPTNQRPRLEPLQEDEYCVPDLG